MDMTIRLLTQESLSAFHQMAEQIEDGNADFVRYVDGMCITTEDIEFTHLESHCRKTFTVEAGSTVKRDFNDKHRRLIFVEKNGRRVIVSGDGGITIE